MQNKFLLLLCFRLPPNYLWKRSFNLWCLHLLKFSIPLQTLRLVLPDLVTFFFFISITIAFTSSSLTKLINPSFREILSKASFGYFSFRYLTKNSSHHFSHLHFLFFIFKTLLSSLSIHQTFWKSLDRFSLNIASLLISFSPSRVDSLWYNSYTY